jgi:hypothetical protein
MFPVINVALNITSNEIALFHVGAEPRDGGWPCVDQERATRNRPPTVTYPENGLPERLRAGMDETHCTGAVEFRATVDLIGASTGQTQTIKGATFQAETLTVLVAAPRQARAIVADSARGDT